MVLVHQGHTGAAIPNYLASRRLKLTQDQLDQSCLAIAILANKDYSRPAIDGKLCSLKERLRAWIGKCNSLQLHRSSVQNSSRMHGKRQIRILLQRGQLLCLCFLTRLHLLNLLLHFLLHRDLPGAAPVLEAVSDVLGELVLLRCLNLQLPLTCLLLLCSPFRPHGVVTLGLCESPSNTTDVQGVGAALINKHPVVRYYHDCSRLPNGIRRKLIAQPHHCLDAKMVGWLIQQQQVGLREESGSKGHPDAPAATESLQLA
mmetsp:Transcript_25993/g.60758  ORF Transcript_25993/g.60758 Transcript_25993/m.60758 type:complete len:259 (-) Transcript_25993:332-1108(-)